MQAIELITQHIILLVIYKFESLVRAVYIRLPHLLGVFFDFVVHSGMVTHMLLAVYRDFG